MRKRLRKKLRAGEFLEHSFWVDATLEPSLPREEVEAMLRDFKYAFLRPMGLYVLHGYPGTARWELCIARRGRGSPTDAEMVTVVDWLQAQPNIVSATAGAAEALS